MKSNHDVFASEVGEGVGGGGKILYMRARYVWLL